MRELQPEVVIPPAPRSLESKLVAQEPGASPYLHRLEALRGVAAMMVALGHSFAILPVLGWRKDLTSVLMLVFNGRAAVTIFFVLSGLVLGLSLRRSNGTFARDTSQFWLRRFFRVYPAYLICTTAIAAYLLFAFKNPGYRATGFWFDQYYGISQHQLTWAKVFKNLILCSYTLNVVTWTLGIEMICSMLLPFLHWAASGLSAFWNGLLLLTLVLFGTLFPDTSAGSFMYMFFAGYLLPFVGPLLFERFQPTFKKYAWLLSGAAVMLLCSRLCRGPDNLLTKAGFLSECLGAIVIIATLVYGAELRVYRFLDLPMVRFYGRISYSFYLWHFFCLFLVSRVVFRHMPLQLVGESPIMCEAGVWFGSTLLATAIAYASYRLVEQPYIRFAKAICSRIRTHKRAPQAVPVPSWPFARKHFHPR
jgi:peptidoglycan/LPS O-acetylase OafA/YrhL